MDTKDIAQPVPGWRDEVHPYPSTVDIEGAIKIHLPVPGGTIGDRCIHICPLDDEVNQHLRLDGCVALKFEQIWAKLQCPSDDAPVGVFIAQDIPQRKRSDHFDGVSIKIMA
jgi:hypothetical protein